MTFPADHAIGAVAVIEALVSNAVVEARKSEVARVDAELRLSDEDEKVNAALVVVVETEIKEFADVTLYEANPPVEVEYLFP